MIAEHNRRAAEDEIRELIEARVQAVRAKDLAQAMAHHAPDVVVFDVVSPLRYRGMETVRQRTQAWFSMYPEGIGYELRDLTVAASEDVAFCHYLYRVTGTTAEGNRVDMWVRATVCFQRVDGAWLVTHDHESVPFDPVSGKASMDLQP
jgi:uncharacterized protein (TIGR02246 family)